MEASMNSKMKMVLKVVVVVAIILLLYKIVALVTFKHVVDNQNQSSFNEWYKEDYLYNSYKANIYIIDTLNEEEIVVYGFNQKHSITFSFRLEYSKNKYFLNQIRIGDTIEKIKAKNLIYLLKDNKRIDSFKLNFLYDIQNE